MRPGNFEAVVADLLPSDPDDVVHGAGLPRAPVTGDLHQTGQERLQRNPSGELVVAALADQRPQDRLSGASVPATVQQVVEAAAGSQRRLAKRPPAQRPVGFG
ncbi:hypothetical protein KSP35_19900 [Aquihabitans sp. G128]|uniref:hypothetical protein n=1 Tax=Aquihabitans sp. G128 TaxID=2849779 RepID=UPI001C226E44|nr:hypothetical protein [Aquihabitans sp. G128]QXC60560.1 hypothetical protein KSP35_19900 [Aquihabitans sp. G128]